MTGPLHSSRQIRRRVFVPVMMAVVALLVVSCFAVLRQRDRCVREKLDGRLAGVVQLFQSKLDDEAELIRALTDSVGRSDPVRQAWLARDREKLLDSVSASFEDIRSQYRVTHFYFHDLEKVCFLRVHNPPRHGDTIQRHTLSTAVESGKTSQGLELGPFGTLTLRVVRPWRIEGQLVGYIELGEGIGHLTPELRKILDAELFFTVDKSYLHRAKWEEGLKMTGQLGQWDLADDFVFVDRTMEEVPSKIIEHLNVVHTDHADQRFTVSVGSRTYRCGIIQLLEAGGRDVGDIFALIDTTKSAAEMKKQLAFLVGFAVAVAGLLGWLFWRYLGWVQGQVIQAQEDLATCVERERHFADDVAHELRTPLAGMRATIDVALRANRESDELRESLEDCSSILGKMESRVDKTLRLARLDGEKVVFNKETIGLKELIEDCWGPLRKRAAARGLTFENRVPSHLTCFSDRGSLAIVFSNLLENGVQYADVNERIWVTADKDSQGAVRVAVANTGSSLGVADVPLAFRQFWRGDDTHDCRQRNAGLGLPLVRRLAAALGGEASGDVDEDGVFTVYVVLDGHSTPATGPDPNRVGDPLPS